MILVNTLLFQQFVNTVPTICKYVTVFMLLFNKDNENKSSVVIQKASKLIMSVKKVTDV